MNLEIYIVVAIFLFVVYKGYKRYRAIEEPKEKVPVKNPTTLEEAILYVDELIHPEHREKLKKNELNINTLHFSLGMKVRNELGLWSGSELREFFFNQGIHHADDMSGIILDSYVKWLRDEPLDLHKQKEKYYDHWEMMGIDPKQKIKEIRENDRKRAEDT